MDKPDLRHVSPAPCAHVPTRRTVNVWLKEGRISARNGSKIRSSFYYLNNVPDPRNPNGSGIDMV